jgi:uncharacterized protein with beta-barrel porin domain
VRPAPQRREGISKKSPFRLLGVALSYFVKFLRASDLHARGSLGACFTIILTLAATLVSRDVARADGGAGSSGSPSGGIGGIDNPTGTGGIGGNASNDSGGGGGGAGTIGGAGGAGDTNGGNGGQGGVHGYVDTSSGLPTSISQGTNGHGGIDGAPAGGGGGGGGAGGYGAVLISSGLLGTLNVSVTGGIGGTGGIGTTTFRGGGAGTGGIGLDFTSGASTTVTINSGVVVKGGNGGTGGDGGSFGAGSGGNGGAGIVGSNLTIIDAGTIKGGFGGAGGASTAGQGIAGTNGNAITFTGGTNVLELQAGFSITGNVVDQTSNGTFRLGGSTNSSFDVSAIGASAQYQGFASYVKTGTSTWTLTGTTTAVTPWTINGGILSLGSTGALGTAGTISFTGGTLQYSASNTTDYSSRFSTAAGQTYHIDTNGQTVAFQTALTSIGGTFTKEGTGTLSFSGANTYSGATTINAGTLMGAATNTFSATSATTINTGGTLDLGFLGQTINTVLLSGGTLANGNLNGAVSSSGGTVSNIGGTAILTANSGTTTLLGVNSYTGVTTVNGGTLALSLGASLTSNVSNAATFSNSGTATGSVNNSSVFNNNATGTVAGLLTNTGGTTTNAGALNGGLTNTAGITVDTGSITGPVTISGGVLTGNGTVASLTIAGGGTFAPGTGTPGSSMTVTGSLALQSGAFYMVQINPTTSSLANVTGTATLGGATVQANYAAGTYVAKQYTILHAAVRVTDTFGAVANTNLPSGFKTTLSYDTNDAFLNLSLAFVPPPGSGLSGNQQAVGNALINFFNTTGSIPLVFGGLTPAGLTQISGETATGSQQTTFDAMNLFMSVMTDPFVAGRGDGFGASNGAPTGYASTQKTGAARDANAMFVKGPVVPFEARWSTWVAGFGGSQTTDGSTTTGSNSATSRIYGTAVGADYRFSPFTIAGFSLAGGGTSFGVAGGGSGHSDLFQAGAFARHTAGQAYISGALAYGWQDITTNRTVSVAGIDQLRAEFNANTFSGRVEGGYRFVAPVAGGGIGITPYSAGQFTTFDLPAYSESVVSGAGTFALAYGAKNVTDSRSELGIRTDKSFAMQDAILTLRGRFAWAHDFNPDRAIGATFQALPGASFIVNGAAQASDSVLTTASAEWKWTNNWSVAATFEGEFSNVTRSYAGKGAVRYAW